MLTDYSLLSPVLSVHKIFHIDKMFLVIFIPFFLIYYNLGLVFVISQSFELVFKTLLSYY